MVVPWLGQSVSHPYTFHYLGQLLKHESSFTGPAKCDEFTDLSK